MEEVSDLLTLQRHLSALSKFAPAKWRFYRGQCPGACVFEVPTTRCVTEHVHVSVAVGLNELEVSCFHRHRLSVLGLA